MWWEGVNRVDYLARMQQYRVDTVFDNELKKVRIEAGLSQKELGDLVNISVNLICQLEIGNISAVCDGKWKPWVVRIANVLRVEIHDLFHREFCKIDSNKLKDHDFVAFEDVHRWEVCYFFDYESVFDVDAINKIVSKSLTKRQEIILWMRCVEDMKLSDIGEEVGLSMERVRQILATSLRKLRYSELRYLYD